LTNGQAGRGVAEAFADDLDRHAGLQEQRRVRMPQVVEPSPRHAGTRDELVEDLREPIRVCRQPQSSPSQASRPSRTARTAMPYAADGVGRLLAHRVDESEDCVGTVIDADSDASGVCHLIGEQS
jgi:hypothetical protein